MAVLLSTDEPVPFAPSDQLERPEGERITYVLRPPTIYDGPRMRAAARRLGGRPWSDAEIFGTLRQGLEAILGDDEPEELARLITFVDQGAVRVLAGEPLDDEMASALAEIERVVEQHYELYRVRAAQRQQFLEDLVIEAARLHIVGWTGLDGTCRPTAGGLPPHQFAKVPPAHVQEIGQEVLLMMAPTDAEKKAS